MRCWRMWRERTRHRPASSMSAPRRCPRRGRRRIRLGRFRRSCRVWRLSARRRLAARCIWLRTSRPHRTTGSGRSSRCATSKAAIVPPVGSAPERIRACTWTSTSNRWLKPGIQTQLRRRRRLGGDGLSSAASGNAGRYRVRGLAICWPRLRGCQLAGRAADSGRGLRAVHRPADSWVGLRCTAAGPGSDESAEDLLHLAGDLHHGRRTLLRRARNRHHNRPWSKTTASGPTACRL